MKRDYLKHKMDSDEDNTVEFPRDIPYDEVSFSSSRSYCVCCADIVRSTQAVSYIYNAAKVRKYYSIFLNSVAAIARNFGAKIIKNVGDSLIFYFPESQDSTDKDTWTDILDCLLALIDARPIINAKLYQEGLPGVNYRISADYGKVEVARSLSSKDDDLFGTTMNMCHKINRIAPANGIVLGGDLYQVIRYLHLDRQDYYLTELEPYSNGHKYPYPVYRLVGSTSNPVNPFKRASKLLAIQNSKLDLKQSQKQESKINIMLVDDEVETLTTFGTILSDENYNVDTFRNGDEAICSFITRSPDHYDLVVTDVRMSPLNGFELYNRLRELSTSVKMLFVSALDGLEEIGCVLPGVKKSQMLRKPVSKEHFIQAVKSILGPHGN
jgi:CheY-like chemotaxis protein/class 3 adenylate cyclase